MTEEVPVSVVPDRGSVDNDLAEAIRLLAAGRSCWCAKGHYGPDVPIHSPTCLFVAKVMAEYDRTQQATEDGPRTFEGMKFKQSGGTRSKMRRGND